MMDSGLVINSQWAFIAASPDGCISCACCGKGVLEIKCLYCYQDTSIQDAVVKDGKFCIKDVNGSLQLDHNHAYYYQVRFFAMYLIVTSVFALLCRTMKSQGSIL